MNTDTKTPTARTRGEQEAPQQTEAQQAEPTMNYFDFEHQGQAQKVEANTWVNERGRLTFFRSIDDDGDVKNVEVASFDDPEARIIPNQVISYRKP